MSELTSPSFPPLATHLLPTLEKGPALGGPDFQNLFQYSAGAILLIMEDGHIADANLQAVDLLGRSRTELITYRIGRLIPAGTEEFLTRVWGLADAEHRLRFHTEIVGGDDAPMLVDVDVSRFEVERQPYVALFLNRPAEDQIRREDLRLFLLEMSRLSHAVGQPATILLSGLELMSQVRSRQPETLDSLIPMALAAAEQLQTLLREMGVHRHRFQRSCGIDCNQPSRDTPPQR